MQYDYYMQASQTYYQLLCTILTELRRIPRKSLMQVCKNVHLIARFVWVLRYRLIKHEQMFSGQSSHQGFNLISGSDYRIHFSRQLRETLKLSLFCSSEDINRFCCQCLIKLKYAVIVAQEARDFLSLVIRGF